MAKLKNIHPGEILLEEFLVPMNLSQNALARAICVPPRRINEIVLGKRAITADSQGIPVGTGLATITGR
jgi:addiction module HigA family antidote